jgi:hypothetical protein
MIHRFLRPHHVAAQLALVAALLLTGCGSSSSHPSTHASAAVRTTTSSATSTTSGSGQASTPAHSGSTTSRNTGTASAPSHQAGTATKTTGSIKPAPTPLPNPNPPPEPGCPKGVVPCVTKSPALKPYGSPMIDVNLEQAMARNQPAVKHAAVTCTDSTEYPIACTVTGSESLHGKVVAIKGTLMVLGVETSTRTYAYALSYGPVTKR